MKRVVIISDLHCGHRAGLTPPTWQYDINSENKERVHYARIQSGIWDWLVEEIKSIGKIDVLICNGDAIDGKGEKSGGTEQLESDMMRQGEMAVECIRQFNANKIYMTYGTPYHTGKSEDFEYIVAKELGAEIHDHPFINVDGLIFDVKHKVSSSVIPHGRHTAIGRESLWNILWATQEEIQPNADITVRSHVHYYAFSETWGKSNLITPALMGFGSKFGSRQCSGIVNIGFISFEVESKTEWKMNHHLLKLKLLSDEVLKA